jgi:hypothetical protein
MSSYKCIAGVSQSLVNLLGDRMVEPAIITVAPPDVQVDQVSGKRLNLYLYHMSENPYLKNQEIPEEGYPAAYGHPPLSLNLQYIFTAFGSTETGADADREAQLILGDAMRVLHEFAIIAANLMQLKSPGKTILDTSLLDEYDQVKLTLQPKSLDEISKIWTALPKVNFRRSVTYEAAVVQIESQQPRTLGPPVRQQNVFALPLQSPQIREVFLQPPQLGIKIAAAEEGEVLRLVGGNFKAPNTTVLMDDVAAAISSLLNERLDVVVPTGKLLAGVHSLVVLQDMMVTVIPGKASVKRGGFSSNAVGFQLLPKITGPATAAAGVVSVPVQPAVPWTLQRDLLLGDFVVPAVPPKPGDPPITLLKFQLPTDTPIASGTYLVRVRVDGAESRLQVDTNPASSTYLQYIGPTFTL